MKRIVPYIIGILLALPLAVLVTFFSSPFWKWFEARTGIESYGHSGPADWCFAATFAVMILIFVVWQMARPRGQ